MSFPRYPRYKDSGVAWLGEVPEHWEAGPIKRRIHKVESGTSVNSTDVPAGSDDLGVLKTSCVYSGRFDDTENKTVSAEDVARVSCPVKAGTLIVSRMNTPSLVGAAGFVSISRANIYLPDRLWQVSFVGADVRFIHYWTQTGLYRSQVEAACTGTSSSMQNLGQDQFGSFICAYPSMEDQSVVADFLDRETATIDGLIAEQQRLIDLLKEKRQAVISHAVTKGLNPQVPMKPSGIEWLGDVPAHWGHAVVRHIVSDHKQGYYTKEEYVESGTPLLRITDIRDDSSIDFRNCPMLSVSDNDRGLFGLEEGDFVFVRSGATIGKFGIVAGKTAAIFGSYTIRFRFKDQYRAGYLKWHFQSRGFLDGLFADLHGGAIVNINAENIKNQFIAIPPTPEQDAICSHLDRMTKEIDALTAEALRAIDLLQERRTALISAAVTGQIDVRHLAEAPAA